MDNFLDKYHIPKLNKDQVNILHRPINYKEASQPKQAQDPIASFSAEFYQNFKEELIPILLKVFHIIETELTLLNSFYEATVTLIVKPHKDSSKKENYSPKSLINKDAKNTQ